ncbi:5-deoxy-glucuronate isomerase [Aeromicrobium halocynthiae]|uniref:5-deoxy-glucuronate isomerase n=1 Tax=Aeromicrobium halocynthiae TaxID=560557 RepID=A0ABN2VW07_9ACTN
MSGQWVIPAGTGGDDGYDLAVVAGERDGWSHTSLWTITLAPGGRRTVSAPGQELLVVPLAGAVDVEVDGSTYALAGRPDVFAGPTDVLYAGVGSDVTLTSTGGGRFAVCGAPTDVGLPARHLPAADVPVELRGAGQSSRQVRNFGMVGVLEAGSIIACEVITPGGNWSSYPAHKHDEATEHESELEEIYYFEVAAGPQGQPGLGFHRTSSTPAGEIDVLHEVRDRDTVLVPHGWHGPCTAAPGHDMYYLNVMAGPAPDRAWLISDHPDQAWIRSTWEHQDIDPRLTGGS